jgi:hypothetical protein
MIPIIVAFFLLASFLFFYLKFPTETMGDDCQVRTGWGPSIILKLIPRMLQNCWEVKTIDQGLKKKQKLKPQSGSSHFRELQGICDLCYSIYPPNSELVSLSLFHNDFDYCIRACCSCRQKYFESHPEVLHHKFNNSWFAASEIKKVLKLSIKNIKDINTNRIVQNRYRGSNQEIIQCNGNDALVAAFAYHGGCIGLINASSHFKYGFNVSKQVNIYNVPRGASNDFVKALLKKYGPIIKLVRYRDHIAVVSYFLWNHSFINVLIYIILCT